MESIQKEWLTGLEVCQALNMNPKQFRVYLRDGVFPKGVKRGKLRVWPKEEIPLLKWLEHNKDRFDRKACQEQSNSAK